MGTFITPRGQVDEEGEVNTTDQGPWRDTVHPQTADPDIDFRGSSTVTMTGPQSTGLPTPSTVDAEGVVHIPH